MADSLEKLKELALQVRTASKEGDNTAEKIGRISLGALVLLENSGAQFDIADGNDSLEILKGQAGQIRNAIKENENTAERVGRVFVGILNLLEHSNIKFESSGGDSVNVLNELSSQVRSATEKGENTSERIGRIFIGILNFLDYSNDDPKEFLVRSDLPGMYYSSTQDAFNAIKATYPDGLTKDVTISCIKAAKEPRKGKYWVASLANWNKGGIYSLVIDGGNKLSYNGKSLGCLQFDHVDNVICRNIDFLNFSNNIETYSPDEMSAITFIGETDSYSRNLYVENCRFNGLSPLNANGLSWYNIVTKNAENVYLVKNNMINCHCIPLKMVDCRMMVLIKNNIKADNSYGVIGHPALCTMSNGYALIAEDNEFSGSTGEYFFALSNIEHIIFRRNTFRDGGGEALNISSKTPVKELMVESNLFVNMLSSPSVSWAMHHIIFSCNVERLDVLNNTVYMSGVAWQQWFLRAQDTHVGVMNYYNNIVIAATASVVRPVAMGVVDTINSGGNIYQVNLQRPGEAMEIIFGATGVNEAHNLVALQAQGLEADTLLFGLNEKVLDIQNGVSSYALLKSISDANPANDGHVPATDVEYKAKAESGNSRGCYNHTGTVVNENDSNVVGYSGKDISEDKSFTNSARYTTYAESVLMLLSNTLNRTRFTAMKAIGSQHSSLILGRYGLFHPMPELDENGEYVADELYTVNMD